MVTELQELIRFLSSNSCLDFNVFCIVPSGWHNDKGTGIRGYHNTYPIFTLGCKALKKMFPKRFLVMVTATRFLLEAFQTLNLPAWVAKCSIFCLLIGRENLLESLTESSMSWPHIFLPISITYSENTTVLPRSALAVATLKR